MTLEQWHKAAVRNHERILELQTQLHELFRERDALFTAAVSGSGEAIDIAVSQKLPARRRTA